MSNIFSAFAPTAALVFLVPSFSLGQGNPQVMFADDFETFIPGLRLVCQDSTNWDTWSSLPCDTVEDPHVTNDVAFSGVTSIWIQERNDFIKPIPDYADGAYSISFRLYVPSGFTASWGQLADFVSPVSSSNSWGFYARFNPYGYGTINADTWDAAQFTYAYDTWMTNRLRVNLDSDWAEFFFEGELVYGWQWTSSSDSTCPLRLSATDIMGGVYPTTGPSQWYIDDYVLERLDPTVGVGPIAYGPREFALKQCYPNPFNPTTTIEYVLPHAAFVTLKVYNLLGEEVGTLASGQHNSGTSTATWDASDLPSGIYFYRLTAGGYAQSMKMALLR